MTNRHKSLAPIDQQGTAKPWMTSCVTTVLLFSTVLVCGIRATAQSGKPKPAELGTAIPLTIGQSMVPLYGPWKFQVGDSPIDPATNKPLWAQPEFDDATWETVDLTPKGAVNPFRGSSGYVPGWGGRGHPGYSGYAWYRIRVRVNAQPGEKLALGGPAYFDDAYQLFLNGTLLGSFGRFDGKRREFYYNEPMVFPLPQTQIVGAGGDRDATQVIAFRIWMSPASLLGQTDAGGFHLAPQVGTTNAVEAEYQLRWLDLVRENAIWALTGTVYSLLAVIAFSLFLFNRTDRVYFWIGSLLLMMGLGGGETALASWTRTITIPAELWVCYVLVIPLVNLSWVMLLRAWFELDRPLWLPWAVALLSLAQALVYAGVLDLLFPLVPSTLAPVFYVLSRVLRVIFGLLMCWIMFRGIRKLGLEGWLLLPPVVLAWGDWLAGQLTFLHVPRRFFPFGVSLSLEQITGFLLVLTLCWLLVRRWVRSALAQRQMTLEMKQAQEVQQVLIPEAVPQIPGFSIQSVYQPAGQVGGDFFQILPAKQGGVLLCIGDVSGKGMPAAMTVSLLVGTLRTLAHYTQSPGEILAAMNQRMLGRSRSGFTTCLVLLAAPDGTVTVANAGHISPYLKGRELPLENGLPLGLMAESAYPEATFHQEEDEQLTLVTDGVVEARAASGELFGFERTAAIAAHSAESISRTAQDFGQDDDITVLTLTRLAVGKQASAPQTRTVMSPSIA
jgi:hypothetical protein